MELKLSREWYENRKDIEDDCSEAAGVPLKSTTDSDSQANELSGVYQMYKGERGEWRWRFKASNGRIIATSSESYARKADCELSIQLMQNGHHVEVEPVP